MEKTFSKMTKAEQRVAIAQDVLSRLHRRKFSAQHMTFVSKATTQDALRGRRLDEELRDIFASAKRPCQVCALGACFLSAVDKFDQLKVNNLIEARFADPSEPEAIEIGSDDVLVYLGRWFSEEQLKLIEMAFERGGGWFDLSFEDDDDPAYKRYKKASVFTKGLRSPKQKMTAIMQNIVDNKGTFKP